MENRKIGQKNLVENIEFSKIAKKFGGKYENWPKKFGGKPQFLLTLHHNSLIMSKLRANYEVDFVIADGYKVTPIEVKSSGYRTHASLDAFCRKYSDRIANRYLIYTKDLRREAGVTYLPVYMTPFI